ncbi:MAG: hypothetical protein QM755_18825 [Luteolibacter sp.]
MIHRIFRHGSPSLVLLCGLLSVSCVQPGHENVTSSSVVSLGKRGDRFMVAVEGRKGMTSRRLDDAALRRCAEVSLEHHYRYFTVIEDRDMTTATMISPGIQNAAANMNHFGGTSGSPISSNPSGVKIRPARVLTIQCHAARPVAEGAVVHDAAGLMGR